MIDELGPTGNYLDHKHTLRHFKEPFYSKLADKGPYSQWAEQRRDHDGAARRSDG